MSLGHPLVPPSEHPQHLAMACFSMPPFLLTQQDCSLGMLLRQSIRLEAPSHSTATTHCSKTPLTKCHMQLLGEDPAKIVNFAGYLRTVFRTDTDPTTLEVAAATLGHLVQTGGALTADVVEFEVPPLQ